MDDKAQTIAASLRHHRENAHETQQDVAIACGFSCGSISVWERGMGMHLQNAWVLADHYGISLDELVGREMPD